MCLAGDSAGGNLCITVSMRAADFGIKMPDGIMAAYPATLMQASASPSRLLTLLDPLLPLSVLSKCLNAYAGREPFSQAGVKGGGCVLENVRLRLNGYNFDSDVQGGRRAAVEGMDQMA